MFHFSKLSSTRAVALPLVLLACVGLSACGGSSSNTTSTAANAAATSSAASSSTPSSAATKAPATPGASTTGASTTPARAGSGASVAGAVQARVTAMRQCLQQHGVTPPQTRAGAGGGILGAKPPKGMTRAQYLELVRKCGSSTGGPAAVGAKRRFSSPRFRQALASFAACLRQNGVNVPPPNTSGKGPIFNIKGINTASPQFRQARQRCRATLVSALRAGATTH
jgi:hypothetical protein